MACSYEQFERVLDPARFYTAGIPRSRALAVALVSTAPFSIMVFSRSLRWISAGYIGFVAISAMTAWAVRRWTLRHWSATSRKTRDALILEHLTDALLAMYPQDLILVREELAIDLAAAGRDQRERRSRYRFPSWFGSLMSACLTAATSITTAAGPQTTAVTISMGLAGATLFLFAKRLVEWSVPPRIFGHEGYVRLLLLAKRRIELELLKKRGAGPIDIGAATLVGGRPRPDSRCPFGAASRP